MSGFVTTPEVTKNVPTIDAFGVALRALVSPFTPLNSSENVLILALASVFSPPGVAGTEGPFVIAPESPNRRTTFITNNSPTTTVYLGFSSTPVSLTSFTLIMPPYRRLALTNPFFTGEIQALFVDAGVVTGNIQFTEFLTLVE
jgi:hypothetical protein